MEGTLWTVLKRGIYQNDLRVFLNWATILMSESTPNKIKSGMIWVIKIGFQQVSHEQVFTPKNKLLQNLTYIYSVKVKLNIQSFSPLLQYSVFFKINLLNSCYLCRVSHVLVSLEIYLGFFKESHLTSFLKPQGILNLVSFNKFLSGWSASAQTIWACFSSYLALGHKHLMLLSRKEHLLLDISPTDTS